MSSLSIPVKNPFQFGVVVDDAAFCNRKDEISFLKDQIRNGYSTWLFSPRRFGKTSLVEKVFREMDQEVTCIYFDLYNISSKDDFCRKYARQVAHELFNWKEDIKKLTKSLSEAFRKLSPTVSFDEFGNPSFSINRQKIENQEDIETILEVPNRIAERTGQRICIAFDEFQEIGRIDPFILNWMRSSFQRHRDIAYVFCGSKQSLMEDIFTDLHSPFYEFAIKMNLSEIGREDLYHFVWNNFERAGLTIEKSTIDTILDKSEGQPHFTQFFASVVFDMLRAGADQHEPDFGDTWLSRILRSQADIFQDIFDQLTNIQRATLLALIRLGDTGIYSEEAKKKFGLPANSSINEALKALLKKGLIHKSGDVFRLSNPVFKAWLLKLSS
ncbi:MAG: ATP-binding protein [Bacteroidales bacterium]|nr:ATP-binding protein [Bacteroidales bacterium]